MAIVQAPLAGRYRFSRRVQAGARTIAWLAIDEQSGEEVVASPLTGPRFAGLIRALGVEHPHLASLLDLVRDPDPSTIPDTDTTTRIAAVGIARYVPGRTLHEELKGGALDPHDAVSTLLHVAEALVQLHAAGAVHGAVSPRSVIVAPTPERLSPVLTQLVAPTSGAYSAPERLRGQGPSVEDDVWALYATLHASLVAGVPFSGGTREELVENMLAGNLHRLDEFGVADEALQQILVEGMTAAADRRQAEVGRFQELMTGWLRDNGYAERDSVVSERDAVVSTQTVPPVSVYEEDDDMTKVFIRGAGESVSSVPWSIPISDLASQPVPEEPAPEPPPAEQPALTSAEDTKAVAPSPGEPASAEPLAEPHVPAPFLVIAPPADAVFPARKGRRRLDSMHLDPFTLSGFAEPTGDVQPSAPPAEGTLPQPATAGPDSEQTAPVPVGVASETGPMRAAVRENAAAVKSDVAPDSASQFGRSGIIKLALLGILIGTGITTCVALTR